MKPATLVIGALVAAAALTAWWLQSSMQGPVDATADATARPAAARSTHASGAHGGSSDASLPIARVSLPTLAPAPSVPKLSPDMRQLKEARAFKELYDRLSALAELTPEQQYVLAEIKAQCSQRQQRQQSRIAQKAALDPTQARAEFASAISEKDPSRQQRLEAYDVTVTNPCAGITLAAGDNGRPLLEAAAAAGDASARAKLLQEQLFSSRMGCKPPPCAWNVNDSQLGTARQLIGGDDPFAMQTAFNMMLMPFENFSLRAGPSELPIDAAAYHAASQILACEMGVDCGASHPVLAQACATQGKCGFLDIRDFTMANIPSGSAALVTEYLEGLRRARTGDWSYFTVVRGPTAGAAAVKGR